MSGAHPRGHRGVDPVKLIERTHSIIIIPLLFVVAGRSGASGTEDMLEAENNRLQDGLSSKVSTLKSVKNISDVLLGLCGDSVFSLGVSHHMHLT